MSVEVFGESAGARLTITQTVPPRPRGDFSLADFWSLALENLRRFLMGVSNVVFCDYSARPVGGVDESVEINAPPETIFRTLIEPSELERYIANKATVEPEPGGRYDFGWGAGPLRILEIDPPRKLSYSWRYETPGETVVTWTLEGSGGRTRLTLVHNGFAPDQLSEDYRTGWLKFLNEIKSMVEIGPDWTAAKLSNPDHEEED